jgi:hypothetical protein
MTPAERAAAPGFTDAQAVVYIISSISAKADFVLERSRP